MKNRQDGLGDNSSSGRNSKHIAVSGDASDLPPAGVMCRRYRHVFSVSTTRKLYPTVDQSSSHLEMTTHIMQMGCDVM